VRRTPRWAAPLLFSLLLAGFAAGIWASYRDAFPGRGLYRTTGVFESRLGDTMMLVRHEAVPGLMDRMESMALIVETRELLDRAALVRGDRVRLTIRETRDALLVVQIQKLP
jgi:hypothetical protein